MTKKIKFMWMIFVTIAIAQTKPLNFSIDKSDHDKSASLQKIVFGPKQQPRNSVFPTKEELITATDPTELTVGTLISTTVRPIVEAITVRPNPLSWFLAPLTQKIQFSPQSFLNDRLVLLKDALNNLGIGVRQNGTAKHLDGPSDLIHFVGPTDSGFYTNRLEPAGFLSGNGWFANKGGILGGPGAIISTGSLFTDYPTPYKK